MGVCVETLRNACRETLDEVADTIEGEMKGIVGGHTRSGAALAAIHIEVESEFSRFVGGTGGEGTLHLLFLNDGNGSGRIYASGKALGKYPGGIPGIGWRKSVKPYKGIHFVEEIASRHGG